MELLQVVRALHILFATLWFGAAAYHVSIIGSTLMQAGPAAGGFLSTLARRGGIGKYFAVNGGLAIVFGGWLFGSMHKAGSIRFGDAHGILLTVGAGLALVAYIHGMVVNMPTERKWIALSNSIKGPPSPEQGQQLAAYGMKLGKAGVLSTILIGLAMLSMLASRLV